MSKFLSNHFTSFTQTEHDAAVEEPVKQRYYDPSRIWNSVELHIKQYEVLGGKVLSRHSLINYLRETIQPHLLVLSTPGVASVVLFRSKASAAFRIVDNADGDCSLQAMSSLGK